MSEQSTIASRKKSFMVKRAFIPQGKVKRLDNPSWTEPAPTIARPRPEESENEHLKALVPFDFTPTSEFELGLHGIYYYYYLFSVLKFG